MESLLDTGPHVWMQIGRGFAVPGEFEAGHSNEEEGKLAAVHFVRFAFLGPAVRAFQDALVFLVMDHPAERARTQLSDETKPVLLQDLRG